MGQLEDKKVVEKNSELTFLDHVNKLTSLLHAHKCTDTHTYIAADKFCIWHLHHLNAILRRYNRKSVGTCYPLKMIGIHGKTSSEGLPSLLFR